MKVEAIEPHGLCAGVNAAISRALALKNVYCLHALVHNEIVVDELRALGFKFVERIEDVPEGGAGGLFHRFGGGFGGFGVGVLRECHTAGEEQQHGDGFLHGNRSVCFSMLML